MKNNDNNNGNNIMCKTAIILSAVFCGIFLLHGEDIRFDETLSGWSRSKGANVALDGDFSGEPAVRLKDGARMIRVFDLEPDSVYELSFHVKGQDIPSGKNDGARIMLNGGKLWQRFTSDAKSGKPETGTFDWKEGRGKIDTARTGTKVKIYLAAGSSGTVWYSGLKLVKKSAGK